MKKINQRGFSPIAILLVLILVVLVGFTGYYVYNSQKKDEKATAVVTTVNKTAAPATAEQSSTQDEQKYLVIKEWDVKIPLTEANSDAYYVYKKFESGGDAVYFSTKSIAAKYPECGADKTTLFAYGRFNDPNKYDDLYGGKLSELYPNAPKVGDYYYTATPPQAGCAFMANGENDTAYQDSTILPARKAFSDAVQKIQAQ